MSRTIQVENPIEGGSHYTTLKRARDYERRGIASIIDGKLMFHALNQQMLESRRQAENERATLQRRGGVYFWNGDSKNKGAMYKPGQRRS